MLLSRSPALRRDARSATGLLDRPRSGIRLLAALSCMAASCIAVRIAFAADAAPVADPAVSEPAAARPETPTPTFTPQDISIGEPISLPFATPLAAPAPDRPPLPSALPPAVGSQPTSAAQLPSVIAPAAPTQLRQALPPVSPLVSPLVSPRRPPDTEASLESAAASAAAGTGWLGIAVDDTLVTGRLVVVEVAPEGPAAKAGVRPQDMLLAIDGHHLRSGDEMAAALAAIVPGQRVRLAVGRDNKVEDVVASAAARPPEALSRDWHSATAGQTVAPRASAPPLAAPAQLVQDTASSIGVLPAPMPAGFAPAVSAPVVAGSEPEPPRPPRPLPSGRTALGVRTVPVDPNVQSRFRLNEAQGAFVIGVVQDLPASRAGLPPGSVIVAINNRPVRSPQDLTQLVSSGPVGTPVPLHYVLPGGQSKQADVVLQSLEQPLERALVGGAGPTAEPPALQPAPLTTRRVQPTAGSDAAEPAPIGRLEQLLRRMSDRLEQVERRLERLEPGR